MKNIIKNLISKNTPDIKEKLLDCFEHYSILSSIKDIEKITFKDGKSIITMCDSRKFYYDPIGGTASELYSIPISGQFEKKETKIVEKLINKGDICFDVGANFGYYSTLLSKAIGRNGLIHAFEPLAHTLRILKNNLKLNNITNVVINELALDEEVCLKTIYLPDIGISGSFKLHKFDNKFEKYNVQTTTLDDYCISNNIQEIDFIKADIEGAEYAMLKGAKNSIIAYNPTLFLEIQSQSTRLFGYETKDIISFLIDLNYQIFFVKNDYLLKVENYETLPDYNFFFIHKSKIESYKTLIK